MSVDMQRGIAAAQRRDAAGAAQWFARAVAADPGNARAVAWLGQSLCASGERLAGTARLRAAGAKMLTDGTDVAALVTIIVQLQHWGDVAGALDLCRPFALAHPANAQVQHLLAVCCSQLNRAEEALAACATAARLAPGQPMLEVLHASIAADAGHFAEAHDRLSAVVVAAADPAATFRAHKELARVDDRRRDYASAFAHLEASAALSGSLPEFARIDRRLIPGMLAAAHDAWSPALLGRWADAGLAGRAPLFVIGFFRSGTTLTQEVLAAHPSIFVADEAGLVHDMLAELARIDPSRDGVAAKVARLDRAGVERLRAHYWSRARGRFGDAVDAPVFVDKFTMNTVDIAFINAVFPDARVVFMLRDPRDVCLSAHMQLMVPTAATVHLLEWRATAAFYAAVMAWWLHIRARLTVPWLEVRYEDAVGDFATTYARILDFVGLGWDPALTDFHVTAAAKFISTPSRNQVAQPLYATSVARWRRYTEPVAAIDAVLAPFVTAFDYPPT